MYQHSDRFPFLSGAYYLAHYVPRSQGGNDELSSYLLQFKDNNQTAVKNWSEFAAVSLRHSGVNFKIIVRALGSSETSANTGTPLDHLGQTIASELGARYMPKLLSKSRQNKSLKYLSPAERAQELIGLYSFKDYGAVQGDNLLLIDDVVTTGTTLKSIFTAITRTCPNVNVYFFSLTKTFDSWRDVNTNSEVYTQMVGQKKNQPSRSSSTPVNYEESEPDWDLMESIFQATSEEEAIIEPSPPGPNLIFQEGEWFPAEGFEWVNASTKDNFTVKKKKAQPPGPNLVDRGDGWSPAKGYAWVDTDDPKNFKVERKARKLKPISSSRSPYENGWTGRHIMAGYLLGLSSVKPNEDNKSVLRKIIGIAITWSNKENQEEAERAVWEVYNWYIKLQTSNVERTQMFLNQVDRLTEIFKGNKKHLVTALDDLINIVKDDEIVSDSDKSIIKRIADSWNIPCPF